MELLVKTAVGKTRPISHYSKPIWFDSVVCSLRANASKRMILCSRSAKTMKYSFYSQKAGLLCEISAKGELAVVKYSSLYLRHKTVVPKLRVVKSQTYLLEEHSTLVDDIVEFLTQENKYSLNQYQKKDVYSYKDSNKLFGSMILELKECDNLNYVVINGATIKVANKDYVKTKVGDYLVIDTDNNYHIVKPNEWLSYINYIV